MANVIVSCIATSKRINTLIVLYLYASWYKYKNVSKIFRHKKTAHESGFSNYMNAYASAMMITLIEVVTSE